jgi:hypothetical protein
MFGLNRISIKSKLALLAGVFIVGFLVFGYLGFDGDPRGTIAASETLLSKSKDSIGWGYTLQREQVRLRDFGNNPVPKSITIETLEDLLRLAKRQKEFATTCRVVETIRADLPELSRWLESKVASLHLLADSVAGLIEVTRYFLDNPWPDCYARQIPVAVDTKFVQRNEATLRQWLDLLLPLLRST